MDAAQGNDEAQSELYKQYRERVLESMTQRCTISADGTASLPRGQVGAMGMAEEG